MCELTFLDCLRGCAANQEFVAQYNRLSGGSLGVDSRSPMERMVDDATGHQAELERMELEDVVGFIEFVYEYVWKSVAS